MGFEVGFNVMYMLKWVEMNGFLFKLKVIDKIVDLFCMVDFFGGIIFKEVKNLFKEVCKYIYVFVGFYGYDNL